MKTPNIFGNNITLSSVNGSIGSVANDINLFLNHNSTEGKLGINSVNGLVNVAEKNSSDVFIKLYL